MNIIITMAGFGKRFRDVGFKEPKYQIKVHGHSLFYWSVKSLKNFIHSENTFIFVTRNEDKACNFIQKQCAYLGIDNYEIIELQSPTDGQATTALHAVDKIKNVDAPVMIYNIDTHVNPRYLRYADIHGSGWLPCFPGRGDHWSFARVGPSGNVVLVREKKRISPHATIGLYYFGSFSLYKEMYDVFYSSTANVEFGEKYIAPLYNQLIDNGFVVHMIQIPIEAVWVLGTPEELEAFSDNYYDEKDMFQ